MPTEAEDGAASLVTRIDSYSRRVSSAVLDQHDGSSVASPLAVWLLLAACSSAASGAARSDLEEALGCSAAEATALLERFLDRPPQALSSALALWARGSDLSTRLVNWSANLPNQVERGPIPSQSVADAWVDRNTQGLIKSFPLEVSQETRLLLACVVASKVRWRRSFEVVSAAENLRETSPWRDRVERVLLDHHGVGHTLLVSTESAGVVAAHVAIAQDDLAVISVAADPTLARETVFEAAYEITRLCRDDRLESARCSLFDLPLGQGHSWQITEDEVATYRAGERSESISGAVLAAWSTRGDLNLRASERFGIEPALSALLGLVGPHPEGDDARALQSAVASYSATGFEAAALSILDLEIGDSSYLLDQRGVERRARLFFDHPHAVIAIAGTSSDFARSRAGHSDIFCLPLFSAWIAEPQEAEEPADGEELTLESWLASRSL